MNSQQEFALKIIYYSSIFIGIIIIGIMEIYYYRRENKMNILSQSDWDTIDMSKKELCAEVIKLRAGIRQHRDRTGHELCWYSPELWNLLPERVSEKLNVPETKEFLDNCAIYRKSLDGK